jgi:hypothetical protein
VLTEASEALRLSGITEDINISGRYQAVTPRVVDMDRVSEADGIRRLPRPRIQAVCARLSRASEARVAVLDYRLAPEHPFPAAPDDMIAGYRGLLDAGCPAATIAFGGESIGGGILALAALPAIRDSSPLGVCAVPPHRHHTEQPGDYRPDTPRPADPRRPPVRGHPPRLPPSGAGSGRAARFAAHYVWASGVPNRSLR